MLNKKNFIFILEKLFEQSKVCYDEFNSADGKIGDGDFMILKRIKERREYFGGWREKKDID